MEVGRVREVVRIGDAVLRARARRLTSSEIVSGRVRQLVRDMEATMESQDGLGIAAPQVRESVRIFIAEVPAFDARVSAFPRTVFFNPVVLVPDADAPTFEMAEACLSVPDRVGRVRRPARVTVRFVDAAGAPRALEAAGYIASVLQHEHDHLLGRLFIDLVAPGELFSTADFSRRGGDALPATLYGDWRWLSEPPLN